jgi:hypothetical protein
VFDVSPDIQKQSLPMCHSASKALCRDTDIFNSNFLSFQGTIIPANSYKFLEFIHFSHFVLIFITFTFILCIILFFH